MRTNTKHVSGNDNSYCPSPIRSSTVAPPRSCCIRPQLVCVARASGALGACVCPDVVCCLRVRDGGYWLPCEITRTCMLHVHVCAGDGLFLPNVGFAPSRLLGARFLSAGIDAMGSASPHPSHLASASQREVVPGHRAHLPRTICPGDAGNARTSPLEAVRAVRANNTHYYKTRINAGSSHCFTPSIIDSDHRATGRMH